MSKACRIPRSPRAGHQGTTPLSLTRLCLTASCTGRPRFRELEEEHGDLLALLAQQEVERKATRHAVLSLAGEAGARALAAAKEQAERACMERFGLFIPGDDSDGEGDEGEGGGGGEGGLFGVDDNYEDYEEDLKDL